MLWEISDKVSRVIIKSAQILGQFQAVKVYVLWVEFLCPLQHIHRLFQQVRVPSLFARLGLSLRID
jgi:hypothetical protein